MSKPLPQKESALFRSIVKYYEIKQYKKGLKAADQILKKYPDHGETLAMKGLTLNCMGKKEEAYEFVRNGIKNDLKSHVCWHVFGLLYRSDRNYNEAIKCYRNAIRIDPENLQIMRDLYLLQVQMRDLKGFAETRRQMLTLKPNNRNNWIGFAIAHHLVGNYQMAIDIIEKYFSTLDSAREANYEDSEIYLYANQLIEESGDLEKALQHLEDSRTMILDTLVWRQKKAELLLRLERYEDAQTLYEELLDINFDNYVYHHGVQCALTQRRDLFNPKEKALPLVLLDFTKEPKGKEMAEKLAAFYESKKEAAAGAKSVACLRLPLGFTSGAAFKKHADALLKHQLTKGVPSLGSDLKTMYASNEKAKIIEELVLSYLKTLEGKKPLLEDGKSSPSTVLLWTNYFAAQHYDRLGQHDKALEYIEKCITQSPKELDFYMRKARILKHTGDLNKAADVMVQGRLLDLADRYINNKATEYLLHADRVEEADATIALFTRHEGDPQQNLYDMQCMWYEIECGQSQLRQKKYGLALKRFFAVEKHINDFVDDQFDFHTYCIRKMTLRAYIQMLRMCDEIYSQKFFVKAAHGAIQVYLELAAKAEALTNGMDTSALSAADKKKAKRAQAKARKAEFLKKQEDELLAKQKKEAEEKEREAAKAAKKTTAPAPRQKEVPKDADPFGEALVAKNALDESWRFATILQQYNGNDVRTHLASFDIATRKQKALLCLQALVRGYKALTHVTNKASVAALEKELDVRRAKFLDDVKNVTDPVVLQVINAKKGELKH
ncbi:N-terminal acetyltransferase a complex subunit nat1-like protein, partial [Globisporangium splendens]